MPFHNLPAKQTPWALFVTTWAENFAAEFNRNQTSNRYHATSRNHPFWHAGDSPCAIIDTQKPDMVKIPEPTFRVELELTDMMAVQITDDEKGGGLVGVIELITEKCKSDERDRRLFTAGTMIHLREGIGMVVIDAITNHDFNPHNNLMAEYVAPQRAKLPEGSPSIAAYRYLTDVYRL